MRLARRIVMVVAAALMFPAASYAQDQAPAPASGGLEVASTPSVTPVGVMQEVPARALVVLRIKDMQELSDKIAKWGKELGVTDQVPPMGDMLGTLSTKAKISTGMKKDGDLAVAMLFGTNGQGPPAPQPLLMIPVSDYAAFVSNFPDAKPDGAITSITLSDGTPGFVTQWGNYAAMSPMKQVLVGPPGGLIITPTTEKLVESSDATVLVNMPAVRAMLVPLMIVGRQQMLMHMDGALRVTPMAKYSAVIRVAFNQIYDLVQKMVSQCNDVAMGASLSADGISVGMLADFKPDGDLGQMLAATKQSDESLLAGLPDSKYILIHGMIGDPKLSVPFMNKMLDPVIVQIQAMGDDGKTPMAYIQAIKDMVGAATGGSMAIVAPEGDLGTSPLIQFIGIRRGDAKMIADASSRLLQLQAQQMQGINAGNPMMPLQVSFTPAAKTVEGVQFDEYHTGFNMGAMGNNPQAAQVGQILAFVYGQDGLNIFGGAVNDNTFLQVGGLSDDKIVAAVDAAKSNADVVGQRPEILATAAQLPKQRVAVFYLPLDVLVNTGFGYAAKFGLDMGVSMPATPPIGLTVGNDGSALRGDLFIPGQLITEGTEIGKKLAGMRGGHGAPGAAGAPGGAAPPPPATGGGL